MALRRRGDGVHYSGDDPHDIRLDDINNLKCRLRNYIEPDFGLLDQLLKCRILTHEQCYDIRALHSAYLMNDAILDRLTSDEQCRKFLSALQNTNQRHVANLILRKGDVTGEHDENRPLDQIQLNTLDDNEYNWVEKIESDIRLLNELEDATIINTRQRQHLECISQLVHRNRKLLELLRHRTIRDYYTFLKLLAKQQPHLINADEIEVSSQNPAPAFIPNNRSRQQDLNLERRIKEAAKMALDLYKREINKVMIKSGANTVDEVYFNSQHERYRNASIAQFERDTADVEKEILRPHRVRLQCQILVLQEDLFSNRPAFGTFVGTFATVAGVGLVAAAGDVIAFRHTARIISAAPVAVPVIIASVAIAAAAASDGLSQILCKLPQNIH